MHRDLALHALPLSASTRLQLMWLASPALPVGGFSYSEGLEAAIDRGLVTDEHQAAAWLRDQLHLGLARAELAVVAQALTAWLSGDLKRIAQLNAWVSQTRETSELRLQSEQMGRSLIEWLRNRRLDGASAHGTTAPAPDPRLAACLSLSTPPNWSVVFALAVAQCLPPDTPAHPDIACEALSSYAFGWAENMSQAAIKAVPLGQSAGQRILQSLVDVIPAVVEHALSLRDEERQAFTPMLAILGSQHETQYSRLFRS